MQRKSNFVTYLLALFPGVGYMYLGLVIKGVETLLIYMLIEPVLSIVGLGFLSGLIKIPIWLYVFFDTINLAKRMDNGEFIKDEDFILNKLNGNSSLNNSGYSNENVKKNIWLVCGWALIVLGGLALTNKLLRSFGLYNLIKSYISMYFIPVIFIIAGIYLLFKTKK